MIENENQENEQEVNTVEENNKAPKKIEVVTGNGDLTISPVYSHLEVEKPKPKETRKIFIPEVKGKTSSSENTEDVENVEENLEEESSSSEQN